MGRNTWYTVDPEDPTFQVVHYRNPYVSEEEREATARRRYRRAIEEAEIMADPLKRYHHERRAEIRRRVAQYSKNPKFYGVSQNELRRYVTAEMGNHDEPQIISKTRRDGDGNPVENKPRRRGGGTGRERRIERNAEAGNLTVKEFGKEFIDKIKTIRTARNLTQEDLAKMVNRTKNEIQALEKGELVFDGGLKSKLIWKLGL